MTFYTTTSSIECRVCFKEKIFRWFSTLCRRVRLKKGLIHSLYRLEADFELALATPLVVSLRIVIEANLAIAKT